MDNNTALYVPQHSYQTSAMLANGIETLTPNLFDKTSMNNVYHMTLLRVAKGVRLPFVIHRPSVQVFILSAMPVDFSGAEDVYIMNSAIHDIKGDNNVQNPSPDPANCANNNPTAESILGSTCAVFVNKALIRNLKTKKPGDQDAEPPVSNSTTQGQLSKTDTTTDPEARSS